MLLPDKLKLNKFKLVILPRNKDYFGRFGLVTSPNNLYSGDASPDDMPSSGRKSDVLADMAERDKILQREELSKQD